MNIHNDETLIDRIKENDQKALECLYEKYYCSLCNFSFNFVKNVEVSEEIVSDVFLNIWLKRRELSIKSDYKSYLFAAVKNQSFNYLVKHKVKFEDLEILDKIGYMSHEESGHSKISYKELEKQVGEILDELPPQRRAIFKLNRIDGLKYKEIAEVLSISVNTVQKQMTESIKFLSNNRITYEAISMTSFFILFYS